MGFCSPNATHPFKFGLKTHSQKVKQMQSNTAHCFKFCLKNAAKKSNKCNQTQHTSSNLVSKHTAEKVKQLQSNTAGTPLTIWSHKKQPKSHTNAIKHSTDLQIWSQNTKRRKVEEKKSNTMHPFKIGLKHCTRGTRDPGIASITWIISPTTKQANSVERKIELHLFQFWPPGGTN